MTSDRISTVADLAVEAIVVVAAIYVMRTPPLRRLAWHLTKYAIGTILPGYLLYETKRAWAETARNHRSPAIMENHGSPAIVNT